MNVKKILEAKKGQKLFLLGNEAAVRGAFEGGVSFVSTYPGTPSSEIGDVFSKLAKKAGVYLNSLQMKRLLWKIQLLQLHRDCVLLFL